MQLYSELLMLPCRWPYFQVALHGKASPHSLMELASIKRCEQKIAWIRLDQAGSSSDGYVITERPRETKVFYFAIVFGLSGITKIAWPSCGATLSCNLAFGKSG